MRRGAWKSVMYIWQPHEHPNPDHMNLSPDWVDELSKLGWAAVHWSAIGDPRATDREIMDWARGNAHVVFTHDLDFGDNARTTPSRCS
jgi:predicted nuclease of predicted toxin-antitoxin system